MQHGGQFSPRDNCLLAYPFVKSLAMQRIALTLPGGGARAAYQAGVLRAVSDICKIKKSPFQIISGVSAGGINAMWMAAGATDFESATSDMWDDWKALDVGDVFKTDALTLLSTGSKWLRNLSLGEWFGKSDVNYLLDTDPLEQMLKQKIRFDAIEENLKSGLLFGVSLSATDYSLSSGVTFFDGDESIKPWERTLNIGVRDKLTLNHVMASAAIPIFFPPVKIGNRDYGDGGIGLKTPLSPAIHMGCARMMVIGVQNPPYIQPEKDTPGRHRATLGDISGTLLNSLFLSSLDTDVARLEKTNRTVSFFTPAQLKKDPDGLRKIELLVIRPSRDLSLIGAKEFAHFPFTIRHVLKGLGVTDQKGWDLLSYLAFDKVYSKALLELGYSDALHRKKEIIQFFKT